jgi:hypothetical protein
MLNEAETCRKFVVPKLHAAGEYAKAKIAYYDAARAAMPTLLQLARGESSGTAEEEEGLAVRAERHKQPFPF